MNSKIIQLFAVGAALIVMMAIVVNVLTNPYQNSIAGFAKYFAAGAFIIGFVGKKFPFYLMIVLAGYSDLIKRLLVVDERISTLDVSFVLMICPLIMAGLAANAFVRNLFSGRLFQKECIVTLMTGAIFTLLIVIRAMGEGLGMFVMVREIAVIGSYAFLPFAVLTHFKNQEDYAKLIRFTIIVFIPVFLYAIHQFYFGFSRFEQIYQMTGISLRTNLDTRPYSTLSQATAVSYTAGFTLFCCVLWRIPFRSDNGAIVRKPLFRNGIDIVLILLCVFTILIVNVRAMYFFAAALLPCAYLCLSKQRTIFMYFAAVTAYLALVFSAGAILESGIIDR